MEKDKFSINSDGSEASVRSAAAYRCPRPRFYFNLKWPTENKGASLVFLWSFVAWSYNEAIVIIVRSAATSLGEGKVYVLSSLIQAALYVFYPMAGWVADVKLGRYRTIKYSLWLLWVGYMIAVVLLTVSKDGKGESVVFYGGVVVVCLLICVGKAGFEANLLAFGTDQLVDGSSETVSSFIHWQLWTWFVCLATINHFLSCTAMSANLLGVTQAFILATGTALALSLDYIFKDCLNVERVVAHNPYKIATGVLHYAATHKTPVRRSAFTYCYSHRPSRMDLGKLEYGGPFTTEQVEDVKTLLRIVLVLISLAGGTLVSTSLFRSLSPFADHLYSNSTRGSDRNVVKYNSHCGSAPLVNNAYFIIGVLAVPLKELVLHPLFKRYFPTILRKLGVAMSLQLICVVILLALSVANVSSIDPKANTCFLDGSEQESKVSYFWVLLPQVVYGVALILFYVGKYEFIVAQAPYNMKGLIIGISYFVEGIASVLAHVLLLPFYGVHVCGIWYFITLFHLTVFQVVSYIFTARYYKPRHRDDSTNIRMFAEAYYEK